MTLGDEIAGAYNAMQEDVELDENDKCYSCGGYGWYVGHEDMCYEHGCVCSGVQVECESCGGTG